jgi:DNA-binding NarL/FixJ family response regulator
MRIVIAEDQVLLRDGVRRLLESAGHEVVGEAADARSLVTAVNGQRPDLVIADVRMPPDYTDDGARAVLYLRDRMPGLPVVVLSQYVEPSLLHLALSANPKAFGYLLKDRVLDTEEFLAQVAEVGGGGTVIDSVIISRSLSAERGRLASLSPRELAVLHAVATGRSNAGIAADLFISIRTVEAHLRSIFDKLELRSVPDGNQRVHATLLWLGIASETVPVAVSSRHAADGTVRSS